MIVTLRQLHVGDIDWITKACQDSEIQRWTLVPGPYLRTNAEDFVTQSQSQPSVFAIADRETNLGVGIISVHEIDQVSGEAKAGYWIAPWARRLGAATQALLQLTSYAKTLQSVKCLTLRISPTNFASRGTAVKCGFVVVRTETATCHDGDVATDGLIYSITL